MRDEDDIRKANLMIERLEAEKNEILTQNEQRGRMSNEVTVNKEQRLLAIERQIDSLTASAINQGQNIEGL
jgi:hypothetical protein